MQKLGKKREKANIITMLVISDGGQCLETLPRKDGVILCTEPESDVDTSCENPGDGQGELSDNLYFTIWLDEGTTPGWQCPENEPACEADKKEGNNILDGIEEPIFEGPASDLIDGWFVFPDKIIASHTYYVGVKWEIPPEIGNIIQGDSLTGSVVMQVVQSRNNPDKVF